MPSLARSALREMGSRFFKEEDIKNLKFNGGISTKAAVTLEDVIND